MIERFLEAFFRHKLLVLLPVVLIPLIVAPISFFLAPSYYEAWAGVWTERPAYLQSDVERSYLTPAQLQKDRLTELLQSRAFVMDVARRTSYASVLGTRTGQDRVNDLIVRNVGMSVNGSHMLAVRFRGTSPQLAVQVLNAVFETYQERSAADQANQGELAISFYQGQLKDGQERLARANDDLQRYLAMNPRVAGPDGIGGRGLSPALADPQAADLLRRLQLEQRNVEGVQQSLDRAQLAVAAAQQGQDMGFQIVDPPQPPLHSTRESKRVLVFPIAGLLLGLGLGAGLLVLLVAGDRAVRSDADLAGHIRVVGTVPRLQVKRLPRAAGPNTTRRAIGFTAGAALPPPREAH
jgi:uncharacterized protein involved in exopolysaccharide biosynthesis